MPHRSSQPRVLLVVLLILGVLVCGNAAARELKHEVKSGQYLSLIAQRYHTTPEAIRKQNQLRKGQTLRPGMVLRIVETPAHKQWRDYLEEKERKKRGALEKQKKKKEAAQKKREEARRKRREQAQRKSREAQQKRAEAQRRQKEAQRKQRDAQRKKVEDQRKHAEAKRRVTRRRASKPKPKRTDAQKRAEASPFQRKPRRPGRVHLVRHREQAHLQLVDGRGRLVKANLPKVHRLMRSLRTGKKHPIDPELLKKLATISDHFGGRTIVLISGFRPKREGQYTKNSRHNHGKAVDFKVIGVPHRVVFDRCREMDHVGCGLYPNSKFVHLDVRKHKTQWTDMSFPGKAPRYVRKRKKKRAGDEDDVAKNERSPSKHRKPSQ